MAFHLTAWAASGGVRGTDDRWNGRISIARKRAC